MPFLPSPLAAAVIVSAALVFCWPLLINEKMLWGMDMSFAAQMTLGMLEGLRDGLIYPRWVDAMSASLGAPAFVFYPPLAHYFSSLLAWLSGDLAQAIELAIALSAAFSAVAFYYAARPVSSEWGAAIGAALYLLLPYHMLDLYDRGAYAELTAFVWLPLVFRFGWELALEGRLRSGIGLALCYSGLILTHIVTAFLLLFALVPLCVYGLWSVRKPAHFWYLAGAGGFALLLCAAFLIPVLVERDQVYFEYFTESSFGNWRRNFVFFNEVAFGFQPDSIKPRVANCVWSVGLLSAVAISVLITQRKRFSAGVFKLAAAYSVLCVWTIFLQTPLSSLVWRYFPGLETAQFPWRFGVLQVACASFLVALVLRDWNWPRTTAIALAALPALYIGTSFFEIRDYVFTDQIARSPKVQGKVIQEYIPRSSGLRTELKKFPRVARPRYRVQQGGRARLIEWTSYERRFEVSSETTTRLQLQTFVYPGWTARIDGEFVEIQPVTAAGLIGIEVPAGEHRIEVRFEPTLDRRIGAGVSLTTALVALGYLGISFFRPRPEVNPKTQS